MSCCPCLFSFQRTESTRPLIDQQPEKRTCITMPPLAPKEIPVPPQIAEELKSILQTDDVAVIIDAKHLCVNSRGIRDIDSSTVTSEFGGKFKDPQVRREFLDYIKFETEF